MSFEERARASAATARDRVDDIEVPEPAVVIARARRRRRVGVGAVAAALIVLLVGTAVVIVARDDEPGVEFGGADERELPAGAVVDGAWTMVPKESAGLGRGSSFGALASSESTLLLAGDDEQGRGVIWRSEDGLYWTATVHPTATSGLRAIALNGDTAIAIGTPEPGEAFVWWSDDAGRHWREVGRGNLFGEPVPNSRPSAFVTGVRWADGFWVAYGGSASGYEGIWISRDGANWTPRLDSRTTGSIDGIVDLDGGRLYAYGGTVAWYSEDGVAWGEPVTLGLPDDLIVVSVAPGADLAVANHVEQHGPPTQVLRSADHGVTWFEPTDVRLSGALIRDPWFWTATTTAGRYVVSGASGSPNRPDAWLGADPTNLERMPTSLRGAGPDIPITPVVPPGGTLSLVASVGDRIAMLGSAPQLDHYFTYEVAPLAEPAAGAGTCGGASRCAVVRRELVRFPCPARSRPDECTTQASKHSFPRGRTAGSRWDSSPVPTRSLVGLTAAAHDAELLTRHARAAATYEALGVPFRLL